MPELKLKKEKRSKPKFKLNNRQKEILGLLNEHLSLGMPPKKQSTLKGSFKIYAQAKRIKPLILHSLGIAKLSLNKIGLQIMLANGQQQSGEPDFDGHGDGYFDF
jgi:hypothetical protein